jgi:hypothetical protein
MSSAVVGVRRGSSRWRGRPGGSRRGGRSGRVPLELVEPGEGALGDPAVAPETGPVARSRYEQSGAHLVGRSPRSAPVLAYSPSTNSATAAKRRPRRAGGSSGNPRLSSMVDSHANASKSAWKAASGLVPSAKPGHMASTHRVVHADPSPRWSGVGPEAKEARRRSLDAFMDQQSLRAAACGLSRTARRPVP